VDLLDFLDSAAAARPSERGLHQPFQLGGAPLRRGAHKGKNARSGRACGTNSANARVLSGARPQCGTGATELILAR